MRAFRLTLLLGVLALVPGCMACGPCQGAEATASPQSSPQSAGWTSLPNSGREPAPQPPAPRHDFGQPPGDQTPDEVSPPPPPSPGPAPVPPGPAPDTTTPPAPAPPVGVKGINRSHTVTTTTTDSEGPGLIISGNVGPVYYNSPGAQPVQPAALVQPQPQPQPQQQFPIALVTTLALQPEVRSFVGTAMKRVGGGLSYMATGICPGKASAPTVAAAPQMYALQPVVTTSYQAVPVQVAQPALAAMPAPAPQYVPVAPQYVPAPQYAVAPTPEAPRKCRLFGR